MSSLQEQLAKLQAPEEKPTGDTADSTYSRVQEILAKVTGSDKESIDPASSLRDDLSISSLDTIEIAVRVESTFGIKVDQNSGFQNFSSVKDIVDFVKNAGSNES